MHARLRATTPQQTAVQEPEQKQALVPSAAVSRLPMWSQMRGGTLQRAEETSAGTPIAAEESGDATCPEEFGGTMGSVQSDALQMLGEVVDHMDAYDGTEPAVTRELLEKYYKSSSKRFARRIARIIRRVHKRAARTHYRCVVAPEKPCDEEGDRAFTLPCLGSLVPVTVCAPTFFEDTPLEQQKSLVHEWFHQYACKGDVAYEHEEEFAGLGTHRALFNADSFSEFVGDYYWAI